MKYIAILSLMISFSLASFAQVAINTDGSAPNGSSMLDISSTNKGILIPRMADHTSVVSPAKGVLVFDSSTNTFWFYNGSAWAELAAGGGGGCTLDQAYDFGGAGNGRIITSDNGAVEFNNGANTAHFINATNVANFTNGSDIVSLIGTGNNVAEITTTGKESALYVSNARATSYGIYAENTNTGVAIYGDISGNSNQYSAIQGVVSSNTNSTAGSYISGLSGYYDGTGIGVGVWGESNGNGATAGAGVFGKGGSNNNFGGMFTSEIYPGLDVRTNSLNQAGQFASRANSYTNPAFYSLGTLQFDVSSGAAPAVHINSIGGGEPSITPSLGDYGYVGTSTYYWYRFYVDELYYKGAANFKNTQIRVKDNLIELTIEDIDNIKPIFYQSSKTTTKIIEGQEYLYKPNLTLGVNSEDIPDYLLDNSFSKISVSGLATLSLVGVKYNRAEIQELKETVSDFGIVKMQTNEIWVNFDNKFSSKLKNDNTPTVTFTTNSPNAKVYISEQNNKGFRIITDNTDNLMINWIAMAKVDVKNEQTDFKDEISPELYKQLRVPADKKIEAKNLHKEPVTQKMMKLIEPNNSKIKHSSKRIKR